MSLCFVCRFYSISTIFSAISSARWRIRQAVEALEHVLQRQETNQHEGGRVWRFKSQKCLQREEIELLLEESLRLKQENEKLKKDADSLSLYKTQNQELKERLDTYKLRLEQAENARMRTSINATNQTDDGSGDKPLGIQEHLNLDWSYGELEVSLWNLIRLFWSSCLRLGNYPGILSEFSNNFLTLSYSLPTSLTWLFELDSSRRSTTWLVDRMPSEYS